LSLGAGLAIPGILVVGTGEGTLAIGSLGDALLTPIGVTTGFLPVKAFGDFIVALGDFIINIRI
jgi:hypothetical protein